MKLFSDFDDLKIHICNQNKIRIENYCKLYEVAIYWNKKLEKKLGDYISSENESGGFYQVRSTLLERQKRTLIAHRRLYMVALHDADDLTDILTGPVSHIRL